MAIAQERGSFVIEEADFCRQVGCTFDTVEEFLAAHYVEHDIHAVMDKEEHATECSLSIVREHDGVQWDGFSPKPRGVQPLHFQVRLFSPQSPANISITLTADTEWAEKLRREKRLG